MGAGVSTPRADASPQEQGEYLLALLLGDRVQDLLDNFWGKLLGQQHALRWDETSVIQACKLLAQNNRVTSHLARLLIHLVWSLQEIASTRETSYVPVKALNATYLSRVFLKYLIENLKTEELMECLSVDLGDAEANFAGLPKGKQNVLDLILRALISFAGSVEILPHTYMVHLEVINLLLIMMSTQLHTGPAAGPKDLHPFLDAAMAQEIESVGLFVNQLLLSYIARLPVPAEAAEHTPFYKGKQLGVFRRVSSAAATVFLLPYYTFSYLVKSTAEFSKSPLADNSLLLLLVLVHYGKTMLVEDSEKFDSGQDTALRLRFDEEVPTFESEAYQLNPYRQALETARDKEFDVGDVEAFAGVVRVPFSALYDTLGACLVDDRSTLLLYSLVHGNPTFLEYVLVRTDLDTLLMPVLEMLYNAPRRTPNQIYMLLIILLILSQDSSFNASIHKLILAGVPWYKERLLPKISLGSLLVVILIRTVKYNLSKLRDVYLHTNCLATLANMAPHVHQLNAYASQRLVSLFDMLARKYTRLTESSSVIKLASIRNGQPVDSVEVAEEEVPTELHIYTDFLRIVLEIINAILTYALPRNPEVVYALLHRQELFQPFRDHPRFYELLENIYTVLEFFNVRMDDQHLNGEWSVERVLQVVVSNARSWRGDGMKTFTQLRFTYEEELHPEEFFIPYVWQLVVSHSGINWDLQTITLFEARAPSEQDMRNGERHKNFEVPDTPRLEV